MIYSNKVFSSLCPCHDYYLEMFARGKDQLFVNKRMIVSSSVGAPLSLDLGNVTGD